VERHGQKQPARAETSEEFADGLQEIQHVVNADDSPLKNATFCFDNPPIHVGRAAKKYLEERGIDYSNRFYIPPLSGSDFNKVIEHAHGRLKRIMLQWYDLHGQARTMDEIVAVTQEVFKRVNQPSTIKKDVLTLKNTYAAILAREGGYVQKKFR
jgi:hypothetical protein